MRHPGRLGQFRLYSAIFVFMEQDRDRTTPTVCMGGPLPKHFTHARGPLWKCPISQDKLDRPVKTYVLQFYTYQLLLLILNHTTRKPVGLLSSCILLLSTRTSLQVLTLDASLFARFTRRLVTGSSVP